jgi:hypothetical protein
VDSGVTYSSYVGASNPKSTGGGTSAPAHPITTTNTAPSSTPTASTSSGSPPATQTQVTTAAPTEVAVYQYYYFTITWSISPLSFLSLTSLTASREYLSWYWSYSPSAATTFTFSEFKYITTTTIVSIYASDSIAASRQSFLSTHFFKLPIPFPIRKKKNHRAKYLNQNPSFLSPKPSLAPPRRQQQAPLPLHSPLPLPPQANLPKLALEIAVVWQVLREHG